MRFIGDVHGKFNIYCDIIRDCPTSIQVGDMGVGFDENPPFDSMSKGKHYFIRGNHDNPEECKKNKYWIKDGSCEFLPDLGHTMFIGGADSIDKAYRIEGLSWWRDEQLSHAEFERIYDKYVTVRPDVMVTHDCPFFIYHYPHLNKVWHNADDRTAKAFDFFYHEHKPKLWVFGHHHKSFDMTINGTRFICLDELEYKDISSLTDS